MQLTLRHVCCVVGNFISSLTFFAHELVYEWKKHAHNTLVTEERTEMTTHVLLTCRDQETGNELFLLSLRAGRPLYGMAIDGGICFPKEWWEQILQTPDVGEVVEELVGQGRLSIEMTHRSGRRYLPTEEETREKLKDAGKRRWEMTKQLLGE